MLNEPFSPIKQTENKKRGDFIVLKKFFELLSDSKRNDLFQIYINNRYRPTLFRVSDHWTRSGQVFTIIKQNSASHPFCAVFNFAAQFETLE